MKKYNKILETNFSAHTINKMDEKQKAILIKALLLSENKEDKISKISNAAKEATKATSDLENSLSFLDEMPLEDVKKSLEYCEKDVDEYPNKNVEKISKKHKYSEISDYLDNLNLQEIEKELYLQKDYFLNKKRIMEIFKMVETQPVTKPKTKPKTDNPLKPKHKPRPKAESINIK